MIRSDAYRIFGVALLVALLGACKKKTETVQPTSPTPSAPAAVAPKNPNAGKSTLARTFDRASLPGIFKQIGLAYHNCVDTTRHGPRNLQELGQYLENNQKILKAIQDGEIVVLYGANPLFMPEGTSNTILAYEKNADRGLRYVLLADTSIKTMNQEDFDKAPKAKAQ